VGLHAVNKKGLLTTDCTDEERIGRMNLFTLGEYREACFALDWRVGACLHATVAAKVAPTSRAKTIVGKCPGACSGELYSVSIREIRGLLGDMECRPQCGACCIAPSITSPIPGMPHGKPAGIPCVQLLPDYRCALFGRPERPAFCAGLRPSEEMCRSSREEALAYLAALEQNTQ
jgi:hypothetical protein